MWRDLSQAKERNEVYRNISCGQGHKNASAFSVVEHKNVKDGQLFYTL